MMIIRAGKVTRWIDGAKARCGTETQEVLGVAPGGASIVLRESNG